MDTGESCGVRLHRIIVSDIYLLRISFNMAFQNNGIAEEWDEERYGKLLETGGGKERMTAHWVSTSFLSKECHPTAATLSSLTISIHPE